MAWNFEKPLKYVVQVEVKPYTARTEFLPKSQGISLTCKIGLKTFSCKFQENMLISVLLHADQSFQSKPCKRLLY